MVHLVCFQSYEVFKHRELGILSRRPPLQWCRELRFLTDPSKPSYLIQTTTSKPYNSFSSHFMKKYEKYLRRESGSTLTNSNASYRKSNDNISANNNHRIRSENRLQPQSASEKATHEVKYNNGESKRDYYERLWPKTNNLRKQLVKPTEAPETGLTALASFPVS